MGCFGETPIFVDTTLDTHLAFAVPPDITAGDLKSKLGWEHSFCFPNLGEIKIHALMVKRKSYFYHLPDSMPINNACQGLVGSWFLFVDAYQLQDMSKREESVPSTSQLSSMETLQHCEFKSRELIGMQGNLSRVNEDSMSNSRDFLSCLNWGNNMTYKNKGMKPQASKCSRDDSIYIEDRTEVLSVPVFTKRKRRVVRQSNAEHVVQETPKVIAMHKFGSVNDTDTLEIISNLNPEEENQEKHTILDEFQNVDKNKKLLLEHPLERKKHDDSSSMYGTPTMSQSEKISVTGLISRYYPDLDEVNSCSRQPFEDAQKLEENEEKERTGCWTKFAESSVDQKSPKKTSESDSHTTCSFHIFACNEKQFKSNHAVRIHENPGKNEITTFFRERQATGSTKKMKKSTDFAVSDDQTCQTNGISVINNVKRFKRRVHKNVVPNTPHSTSKVFSLPSPFDNKMEASGSKVDKYQVGKRLIKAANSIQFSVSEKEVQKSMFIPTCVYLSIAKSPELVKNNAFEFSDSDD